MDDSETHPGETLSSPHAEEDVANRRRSTRLLVAVPVTISGQNARGEAFREEARTIIVHLHGASIVTSQPLAPGSEITVENSPLRMAVRARVTRFLKPTSSTGFGQIDVELFEPRNIWGIKYPPADWQKAPSSAIPSQAAPVQTQLAGAARIEPVGQPISFALSPVVGRQRVSVESPGASAELATRHSELGSQHQLSAANFEAAKSLNSAGNGSSIDARRPSSQHSPAHHPDEKETLFSSLDQRLADATARAEKSAVHLEELTLKIEETRRQAHIQTEEAKKSVEEALEEAFQTIRRETDKNLSQSLESVRSSFLEETRRTVADQVSTLSQEFKHEIGGSLGDVVTERLSNATSELDARQSRTLEDTQERVRRLLDASLQDFQRQLQESVQSLRESALSNMARDDAARFALDYESQKAEVAEQAGAQARQIVGSTLEDFQTQLRQSAEDLRQSAAAAIVAESAARAAVEIQTRQAEITGQSEAQIQTVVRTELESFQVQLRQSAEDLRRSAAAAIAEESAARAKVEIQARQAEIAGQSEAQIQTVVRAELESFQAQLRQSAEDLRQSAAAAIVAESAARATVELQARQAEIAGQSEAQIQTVVRAELESFQTRLRQSAEDLRQSAAASIAEESAARATVELQARQAEIASQIETQMRFIVDSSAEGFAAESARAVTQFRESVLPGLTNECAAASAEEMRQVQREAVQQTAEQIQGVMQSALGGFGEQLHSFEQTLSERAEETLRLPTERLKQYAEDAATIVQERTSSLRTSEIELAQSQLAAMTRGALASMTEEVKATIEECRSQVRGIFEGLRERSAAVAESYFKEALDHSRESVMQRLQKDAEDFTTVAVAQFQSRSSEAVEAATEAIHKQVGSAAFVVKDWLDQAAQQMDARVARLEARSDSALEAIDHRSQDLSRVVLGNFQKESEAVLASLRLRIQNAVKALDAPEPESSLVNVHSGSPAQQSQELPLSSSEG